MTYDGETHEQEAHLLAMAGSPSTFRRQLLEVAAGAKPADMWHQAQADADAPTLFPNTSAIEAAHETLQTWHSEDYHFTSLYRDNFPTVLRVVFDCPAFLFYKGNIDLLAHKDCISIVGSRDATPTALAKIPRVVQLVNDAGFAIASGLARGVDACAHEETLRVGGTPVGVIATPIHGPYTPAETRELHAHVEKSGLLVSQFLPGSSVHKGNFIARNTTMSGLSKATIVVHARDNSGTRHQVKAALGHGHQVLLLEDAMADASWAKDTVKQYEAAVAINSPEELAAHLTRLAQPSSVLEFCQ